MLLGSVMGGIGMWISCAYLQAGLGPRAVVYALQQERVGFLRGCASSGSASLQKVSSSTVSVLLQVLIFAEKKADVDAIHEYLLLKGVEAVAIHGGKGQ